MDHRVNVGVLGKNGLHLVGVAQLRLDKGDGLSHDLLHPAQRLGGGIDQIVRHHNLVARLNQLHAGMAADIAGAAAHKDRHEHAPFIH